MTKRSGGRATIQSCRGLARTVIHFGAVVTPSPFTHEGFYAALEGEHIGHYSVWDEGAHGPPDPVMGAGWWDVGWSRIFDPKSHLTRRAPFPAFSRSSANGNPGDGTGNGKMPFDAESGFAAEVDVAGDCGWSGDLAGAFNRFLRWDATAIVDTREKLSIPLYVVTSPGAAPPKEGDEGRSLHGRAPDPRRRDAAARAAVPSLPGRSGALALWRRAGRRDGVAGWERHHRITPHHDHRDAGR